MKNNNWINAKKTLPENGMIVEIRVAKQTCRCGGYQIRECYYENGFTGILKQEFVENWRVSPANDLIKEIDQRKSVVAKDCVFLHKLNIMKTQNIQSVNNSRKGCRGCGQKTSYESMIGKTFENKKRCTQKTKSQGY